MSNPVTHASIADATDWYIVATRNYVYRISKHGDRWHLRAVRADGATTVVEDMFVDWLEEVSIGAGLPVNWPGFAPADYEPADPVYAIIPMKRNERKITSFRLD